jgi:GGDEF domain-containing protein
VQAEMKYPGGVARIDKVVQFGQIDAMRQQAYGGPKADNGGGGANHLLLYLLIAAAIAGCLVALEVRRRRSGEGALRRRLPREIAHARETGEPLSVILVPADHGRSARELASAVRGSLRSRDLLFRLEDAGLMVVSPDTGPEGGEMLAAEVRRQLVRDGGAGAAVIPITSAAESTAEELLEAAAAGADAATSGNGGAGMESSRQAAPIAHSKPQA